MSCDQKFIFAETAPKSIHHAWRQIVTFKSGHEHGGHLMKISPNLLLARTCEKFSFSFFSEQNADGRGKFSHILVSIGVGKHVKLYLYPLDVHKETEAVNNEGTQTMTITSENTFQSV
jgi:hypothetical protein